MSKVFGTKPSVFTIPAGVSFLEALSKGLDQIQKDLAIEAPEITLFLPTQRSIRAFQEHVLKKRDGRPVLLPSLRALGDLDEDDVALGSLWALGAELDLAPPVSTLQRRFLLQNQLKNLSRHPGLKDITAQQRLMLGDELAKLFDQMHEEELPEKALEGLVPEDLADHWKDILEILHVVTRKWPEILKAKGFDDPVRRRKQIIDAVIETWKEKPPTGPVIAAGSTGSKPAIRKLLKAVANLPNGAVVFPALDTEMDLESWDTLGETHPQFAMKKTLEEIKINRGKVAPWPFAGELDRDVAGRLDFFREALRPPETTGAWPHLEIKAAEIHKTFAVLECPTPRIEAGAIAMIMRETVETKGKTAALITPDRGLAARVREELKRWNLNVDDSAGTSLALTPAGTYFALLAEMVSGGFSPVLLLSFLKHPLTAAGIDRQALLALARRIDKAVLRGVRPRPGLANLMRIVKSLNDLPDKDKICDLLRALQKETADLEKGMSQKGMQFAELFDAHVKAADSMAKIKGEDTSSLWHKADGERLAAFVKEVREFGSELGDIAGDEYSGILRTLMERVQVRRPFGSHPRLSIWGTLEARLQTPDVAILAGLNEGVWPPEPAADPWMSREMRKTIGLPTTEFRIGQSAHDFYLSSGAKEVILTRASKVEGTPTTPSRWLQRIDALLRGNPRRGRHPWADWFAALDEPNVDDAISILPPKPKPPLEKRPKKLSVTGIELLMRDPYAVYAKYILDLKPLDELELDPGAADKGILLHEIFEAFLKKCKGCLPEDAVEQLIEVGEEAFRKQGILQPSVKAFWWPRFVAVAKAFIALQRAQEQNFEIAAMETKGGLDLSVGGGFELVAKADRIDRARIGGGYKIIDYKTGSIPYNSDILRGKKPQLSLEAVMLEDGAFPEVGKGQVAGFEFWDIGKTAPDLEVKAFSGDVRDCIKEAREGLLALIEAFAKLETPYLATPDPDNPGYGDYDPLSRLGEWQNKAPDAEDGA